MEGERVADWEDGGLGPEYRSGARGEPECRIREKGTRRGRVRAWRHGLMVGQPERGGAIAGAEPKVEGAQHSTEV